MKFWKLLPVLALACLSLNAADVPRKSPELAVSLPQGKQLLLSQYRGKVVLLEFIYTTCPHCQASSKVINGLYSEFGAKGFQPLQVAFNPNADQLVPQFIRDLGTKYPVGFSTRESVAAYLGISPETLMSVPQVVFIDKKGVIRQQSLPREDAVTASPENMRKMVETLLKENAAPAKSAVASHHKKA